MKKLLIALFAILAVVRFAFAQAGRLDYSFDAGYFVNGIVNKAIVQPDGKILIGGSFMEFNNIGLNGIARLNSDGSLDTTFNPGTGCSGIRDMVLQPDGKIIIAGPFASYNGTPRARMARVNTDGSLDTVFDPGSGPDTTVLFVTLDGNNKVLIGGKFTTVDGVARGRIARLNSDGSLDTTFNPGAGATVATYVEVNNILALPDGKYLLTGLFSKYDNVDRYRIARTNNDGSLDTTFNPGPGGFWGTARLLHYLPDGKVLAVGSINEYNDEPVSNVIRINTNGTRDTLFTPVVELGFASSIISAVIQPDNKILIAGDFEECNGIQRMYIARLLPDGGTVDTSFDAGNIPGSSYISELALQPDGKVIVAGEIYQFGDSLRYRIARLLSDAGTTDIASVSNDVDLLIYPVPASEQLQVRVSQGFVRQIQLYNMQGQSVSQPITFSAADVCSVSVRQLPPGLYMLRATTSANQIFTRKIFVE